MEYLEAGADIVTTVTYQSTVERICTEFSVSPVEAKKLLQSATTLMRKAREDFWTGLSDEEKACRRYPLVAASLGPMAAILPGECEYEGTYSGLSRESFIEFHERRIMSVSEKSRPDVLAFETIPSHIEAQAIASIMSKPELQEFPYWMSFQCRASQCIANGELLHATVISVLEACGGSAGNLVALGVNCVHPEIAAALVRTVKAACSEFMNRGTRPPWSIHSIAYANDGAGWSGTDWDAASSAPRSEWALLALTSGASIIGGCCRTGPAHIRLLSEMTRSERRRSEYEKKNAVGKHCGNRISRTE